MFSEITLGVLSRGEYIINHWFTVCWITLATIYTYWAVIADIIEARKLRKEKEQSS